MVGCKLLEMLHHQHFTGLQALFLPILGTRQINRFSSQGAFPAFINLGKVT